MIYSRKVIESLNPGTGKSEYIHGIAIISRSIQDVNFSQVFLGFEELKNL